MSTNYGNGDGLGGRRAWYRLEWLRNEWTGFWFFGALLIGSVVTVVVDSVLLVAHLPVA